ncbi:MAG: cupin domain-containing protein [Acidobacteria bacterium]|nr:MAG: cupin domain-containing protein [Acidobacteriota bacterium]
MNALSIPAPGRDAYREFIRSRDVSVGVYRLAAGAVDSQRPHSEDEVYYVLKGRAKFTGDGRTIDVHPGLCIFVAAGELHRFHDVVEALEVLVLFGPAEGTRAAGE